MGKYFKQAVIFIAIFGVIVVALIYFNKAKDTSTQTAGVDYYSNGAATSEAVQQNDPPSTNAPSTSTTVAGTVPVTDKTHAIIETNKGKIVFSFYPNKAPNTVQNFIKLANSGYYNGIKWHRVVPGFVIQGGDPLSKDNDPNNDGSGGPGYTVKAEFNDLQHVVGTVAMARSDDPDSAGSQFYICLGTLPDLDGKYTIFGQVTEGMDVVNSIQVGDIMKQVYIEEKK
ncbi:MAG: peptidylprolyl isomerase [Candidatus Aquicultor sp.]